MGRELIRGQQTFSLKATGDAPEVISANRSLGSPGRLNALETPFTEVMEHITEGDLSKENCKFSNNCTFTVYMVSKEYAVSKATEPCVFTLNPDKIRQAGLKLYFANAKQIGENTYTSVSTSRLCAICGVGKNLDEIKKKVYEVMEENVDTKLDYRKDIGNIYVH